MPRIELADFGSASGEASLITEALLASLLAATRLAEITARRYHGMTFAQRFTYGFWHHAMPGCPFSGVVYWLFWERSAQ